jgi:hypothetical protein
MTGFAQNMQAQAVSALSIIMDFRRWAVAAAAIAVLVALGACQPAVPIENETSDASEELSAAAGTIESTDTTSVKPLALEDAVQPVRLQIPDVGLDAPVTPMGWRVVTQDGERTTSWDVPLDAVGWHANSAGAGAAGNVILSGRQADGEALLEPLALGSVTPGQDVLLTDENGQEFVYRVREVSEPIPISGATEEEEEEALAYVIEDDGARLTLISGWPEFTTTHRIFAVADLVAGPN